VPFALNCTSAAASNLGDVRLHQGDFAAAEAYMQQSIAAGQQVAPPDRSWIISRTRFLGRIYDAAARPADAEAAYRRAVTFAEANGIADPGTLGDCLGDLVGPLSLLDRQDEAVRVGQRALMLDGLAGRASGAAYVAVALNLSVALNALDRSREAEALLRDAMWKQPFGGSPADPANALLPMRLAITLARLGQNAEAERLFRQALAAWDEHPPAQANLDQLEALIGLGHLYGNEGRPAEAEPLLQRACAFR
jgi:tetratricopeptide (TPR) repeat protein